jgi:hypothetical protein
LGEGPPSGADVKLCNSYRLENWKDVIELGVAIECFGFSKTCNEAVADCVEKLSALRKWRTPRYQEITPNQSSRTIT